MSEKRITSYDAFRGLLLIGMVIFHVLVNLTQLEFNQNYFYIVPLGFILFLGIILGRFLAGKNKKTISLGIKLAMIFLILNIPNFTSKNFTATQFILGDQKIFSFEILLPMSMVTLSSLGLNKFIKKRNAAIFTSLALLLILTYLYSINIYFYNLSFLIYGIVGYFIGRNTDLDKLSKKLSWKAFTIIIISSLAPFFAINHFGNVEVLVIFQTLALYLLTAKIFSKNNLLIILGKHSLFLYILHIVLIKIISGF